MDTVPAHLESALVVEAPSLDKILRLEHALKQLPQLEIKTTHHFAKGLYAREIFIPAGTVLTGKIHKEEHLNILSQGEMTVWTEDGMKRVKAPFTVVTKPGAKRVGYAHEDSTWTTIHAADETDVPTLEAKLVFADDSEYLEHLKDHPPLEIA